VTNPVFAREALNRFRGRRAWPFLLIWILGNGVVVYLLLILATSFDAGFGALIGRRIVGPFMFQGVCVLMILAIVMMIPGTAAVAVVGERERQTLQLVQVTPLSSLEIVLGKLWSVLGYVGWLLAAVLPVIAAPLLLGGVRLWDVLSALLMLGLVAFTIASLSMWVSARAKSSRAAVTGAYLIAFALLFGTPLLAVGELYVQTRFREEPSGELWTLIPNPYIAVVAAVAHPLELEPTGDGAFLPGHLVLLSRDAASNEFGQAVQADRIVEEDGHRFLRPSRPPLWILSGFVYLALSAFGIYRACRWVRTPAPSEFRVRRIRT